MNQQADPTGFGKFVPGFDFLQKLAQGGNASLAGWVAPTLDTQALDKRIDELKAVQFWLDQNAAALKATIQALEVQKLTLATLKTMNAPMPGGPAAAAQPAAAPQPAAPLPDPMQFWGALTQQFQQIASQALQDAAARSAPAAAAAKTAPPQPQTPPPKKTAARSRKKTP
jgi:hypothetical protein